MKCFLILVISILSFSIYGQTKKDTANTAYYIFDYSSKGLNKLNSKDFKGALELFTKATKLGAKCMIEWGYVKWA